MFFNLHREGKIGFKKLSDADLGLGNSHQTHIGLMEDVFTFLHDRDVEEEAMFIYKNEISFINCYFDRIQTPNGTFRSPKIRKGDPNSISVTKVIRDITHNKPNKNWFLMFFGLESEQMVFYIFNDQSEDYIVLNNIIDTSKKNTVFSITDNAFNPILKYIEDKINKNGKHIIKELEIASQIATENKYRFFDLEKANRIFRDIGQKGEALVADFLEKKRINNKIFNYIWYNKNTETGLPYDFSVQLQNQSIIYIDVKSTSHQFDMPMIFSQNEIRCICNKSFYHVYRVYDLSNEMKNPKLRICENSKDLAKDISINIDSLIISLQDIQVSLKETKLAIKPSHKSLTFSKDIELLI